MQAGLVTIVLLNWNGNKHVHRCVEHIIMQSYAKYEVIVVDNGSRDGSIELLKEKYPQFTYIINKSNRGYAIGMNQGIELSKGEYLIPLNQDVCLHTDYIANCVEKMSKDQSLGVAGGKVYAWIGDELTSKLRDGDGGISYLRKRFQGVGGVQSDFESISFFPPGSFPFLRMRMLDDLYQISGYYYDEQFGSGWEDTDLFLRMHLRGWKCIYLPSASGWHVGSGSVGGKSLFLEKDLGYQMCVLRNRYFTIIKNLPLDILIWLSPYLIITEIGIPFLFLCRSPKSLVALIAAWGCVIWNFLNLIKKRSLIQNNIQIPKGHLKSIFCSY